MHCEPKMSHLWQCKHGQLRATILKTSAVWSESLDGVRLSIALVFKMAIRRLGLHRSLASQRACLCKKHTRNRNICPCAAWTATTTRRESRIRYLFGFKFQSTGGNIRSAQVTGLQKAQEILEEKKKFTILNEELNMRLR